MRHPLRSAAGPLGNLESGPAGLLSPWSVIIVTAAGFFRPYASARSLQIGDGVAVIAVTSVAANLSTMLAGLAVFGDRLGDSASVIVARLVSFFVILVGAALTPARSRAGASSLSSDRVVRRPAAAAGASDDREDVPAVRVIVLIAAACVLAAGMLGVAVAG